MNSKEAERRWKHTTSSCDHSYFYEPTDFPIRIDEESRLKTSSLSLSLERFSDIIPLEIQRVSKNISAKMDATKQMWFFAADFFIISSKMAMYH